jgi:SAM-dependent methyltransferase
MLVRRFIPQDKNIRIADLGCGYGSFLKVLQEQGYRNSFGVDISPQQVELAASLGVKGVSQGGVFDFLRDLPDSSLDVVIVIDILEHLTLDELFLIGDEMHRVLVPRGICVMHVPNGEGLFGLRIRYGDLTHERTFTAKSIDQFAGVVGLEVRSIHEDVPVIHGVKSFVRYVLWKVGTLPARLIFMAETGSKSCCLSSNVLAILANNKP